MYGWVGGWTLVKAVLRIAYSNQKLTFCPLRNKTRLRLCGVVLINNKYILIKQQLKYIVKNFSLYSLSCPFSKKILGWLQETSLAEHV